jgi:hypothetical protein
MLLVKYPLAERVQQYYYVAPGVTNVDSVAEFAKGVHRRGSSDRIKDIARIE